MKSKYLVPIIIVILLVIVLVVYQLMSKKKTAVSPAGQNATTTGAAPDKVPAPYTPITPIPSGQVPKELPTNLPVEKGTEVMQNFEVKDQATGKTQSSRVYVSKKTIDDNFAIYQKYLQDNGWTIGTSFNQPAAKSLNATKGTARMDINMLKDPDNKVTVSVSFVN